jgi:hypothetical protein
VAAEIGKRCPGKSDPAFEAALNESIALLDQYVSVNSHVGSAYIAKFKNEQGGVGAGNEVLCRGDTLGVYDVLHTQGGSGVIEATRKIVARAGPPTWGDCP